MLALLVFTYSRQGFLNVSLIIIWTLLDNLDTQTRPFQSTFNQYLGAGAPLTLATWQSSPSSWTITAHFWEYQNWSSSYLFVQALQSPLSPSCQNTPKQDVKSSVNYFQGTYHVDNGHDQNFCLIILSRSPFSPHGTVGQVTKLNIVYHLWRDQLHPFWPIKNGPRGSQGAPKTAISGHIWP